METMPETAAVKTPGHRRRLLAGAATAASACLVLTACGSSSDDNSGSAAASSSGSAATSGATSADFSRVVSQARDGLVTAKGLSSLDLSSVKEITGFDGPTPIKQPTGKQKLSIIGCAPVGSCLNTSNDVRDIATKLGWSASISNGDGTPQSYQQLFSAALSQHADAIIAVGVSGVFVQQQLAQAEQQGVVTIGVNVSPLGGAGYAGYVDGREPVAKGLLASWIATDSHEKAKAIFLDVQGNPDLAVQVGATLLKQCSTCSVQTESWAPADMINPATQQQKITALLQSHPDAQYLVLPTDGLALTPIFQAISQAGLSGKLKVVSADLGPSSLAPVRSGQLSAVTVMSQEWLALASIDAVNRGLAKQPIPAADAWGIGVGLIEKSNAPSTAAYSAYDRYVQSKVDFVAPYAKAWDVDLSSIG
jgi:ABC-type sugar transport system substrate-binding protein